MFKLPNFGLKKFFLKQELKSLIEREKELTEIRAKLVYKPALEDIPDKLDECVKVAKKIKKVKKKIEKVNKQLSEL